MSEKEEYIRIEKGNRGNVIGRIISADKDHPGRGKIVFLDHLVSEPIPYDQVRIATIVQETEKWCKAGSLRMPEIVPADMDRGMYPYVDVCHMDWTAELEKNKDGGIDTILLKVYRCYDYQEKWLQDAISFRRPKNLDKDEIYHCRITKISVDWPIGKVYATIALPENLNTQCRLDDRFFLGNIIEIKFAAEELNKQIKAEMIARENVLKGHDIWWQNLPLKLKEFLTVFNGEWWETDDKKFVNHDPIMGHDYSTFRIFVKQEDYELLTIELSKFILDKFDLSNKEAYKGVGFCEIFTKSFEYSYNNVVKIIITIFVDTDGNYDSTGDEIKIQRLPS